jgi:uncharacterized cupin superfamily protein
MEIFNLHGDDRDDGNDRDGWRWRRAAVGRRLNAELMGASLYDLEPGCRLWPYHTHHHNEEWLLVVSGRPTLRTAEGEQELREGDVACFRRGPDGLHQVSNRTDEPVRVLMLSTMLMPELVDYPDSGKLGARSAAGERLFLMRPGPDVDYWDGENGEASTTLPS